MSFSQFGYPYSSNSQLLVSTSPSTVCYDSATRSLPNIPAVSAQTTAICCPSYEKRLLVSSKTDLSLGSYNTAYGTAGTGYAGFIPYSSDPATFYPTLTPQYETKDGNSSLHPGIAQPAAYYPYDHSLGRYQYNRFGAVDFTGSAKRKNATRETTSTLKTWLYEHRKNPYPTKGEKIMLAIITKMTLTQVSTWFANARRRLKKENKMTWTSKSKPGDESKNGKQEESIYESENSESSNSSRSRKKCSSMPFEDFNAFSCNEKNTEAFLGLLVDKTSTGEDSNHLDNCENNEKPRIWSLAQTASASITMDVKNNENKSLKSDCALVSKRHHSLCREVGDLHNRRTDSAFESFSLSNCKTSTMNIQSFQLSCSYPVLSESFLYSSAKEITKTLKTSQETLGLKQSIEEQRTAFKPVVKRLANI